MLSSRHWFQAIAVIASTTIFTSSNAFTISSSSSGVRSRSVSVEVKGSTHNPTTNEIGSLLRQDNKNEVTVKSEQSRRSMFSTAATMAFSSLLISSNSISKMALADDDVDPQQSKKVEKVKKVLVLGVTGFVGSEVKSQLESMNVEVIGTSRDGRDGTKALDFTNPQTNIVQSVESLAGGCDAVISCIGSIGTKEDQIVNAGTGLAAKAAKSAGVSRFVYVSVAPEVRASTQSIGFLKDYMEGKSFSEESITQNFGSSNSLVIEPTFIYGGDVFQLNPPRVAGFYGEFIEGLLSSSPFRAAAKVAPGIVGVALEPPISVKDVAGAAVSGALGLSSDVLDTYDQIRDAAAKL